MSSGLTMAGAGKNKDGDERRLSEDEVRRRKVRSVVIAVGLGVLAIMFYAATIVRLGGNALNKVI